MTDICIITPRYPTSVDPTALTFVQQLAWSMADLGKKVRIICPLPVNINRKFRSVPDKITETTSNGMTLKVYFPKFWGFGQRSVGPLNTAVVTSHFFIKAVEKVIQGFSKKPEALYGHFFTPAGITACTLGEQFNIPAFIAYGESSPWSIVHYGLERTKKVVKNVKGIISVSTHNKNELERLGIVRRDKIAVFPNGYNPDRFSPKDKNESRKRFGIKKDAFVVAFVGHFIKRKGIDVLSAAVEAIPDTYMICAGKGELKPEGHHVLFAAPVNPDELSYFYSAADVFVLPTTNEGCCNAIIEAMACGLPIISSDLPFNYDILNESNSILIDPNSISQIKSAITQIKNNEIRNSMSISSLEYSKSLTLASRSKNIISFIEALL